MRGTTFEITSTVRARGSSVSEQEPRFDADKARRPVTRGELWEILAAQEELIAKIFYLSQLAANAAEREAVTEEVLERIRDNHNQITDLITTGYEASVTSG